MPRRKGSNSGLILEAVSNALGDRVEVRDLKNTENWDAWAAAFPHETHVMFFMPLYVHAMPSHVMAFMGNSRHPQGHSAFLSSPGFPKATSPTTWRLILNSWPRG